MKYSYFYQPFATAYNPPELICESNEDKFMYLVEFSEKNRKNRKTEKTEKTEKPTFHKTETETETEKPTFEKPKPKPTPKNRLYFRFRHTNGRGFDSARGRLLFAASHKCTMYFIF